MEPDTWKQREFDERQRKEINLAIIYARDFAHGTDGHNAKMIIAKMAQLLDVAEGSAYSAEQEVVAPRPHL